MTDLTDRKTHLDLPEAVEVSGLAGIHAGQDLRRDRIALVDELLQYPRHRHGVMEDNEIGYDAVLADEFTLLFAVFLPDDAVTTEADPFREAVLGLRVFAQESSPYGHCPAAKCPSADGCQFYEEPQLSRLNSESVSGFYLGKGGWLQLCWCYP